MIEETEAKIIKFIYDAFLQDTPLYIIKEQARAIGFTRRGNTSIERVLSNPVYAGMLQVQGYKEFPGGIFPGIHEAIIDSTSWQIVQSKMKKPVHSRNVLDESSASRSSKMSLWKLPDRSSFKEQIGQIFLLLQM